MMNTLVSATFLASTVFAAPDYVDYHNQDHWHLFPASIVGPHTNQKLNYCAMQVQQSPINFDPRLTSRCPLGGNGELEWTLSSSVADYTLINNGHSVAIKPVVPEGTNSAVLTNKFSTAPGEHEYYCLDSIHFHWGMMEGTGTEHCINGHHDALELHFVHYACKYGSLSAAKLAETWTDPYKLAVVGVMVKVGEANGFFEDVINNILSLKTAGSQASIFGADIEDLVPGFKGSGQFGEYYHYKGSLTTPPCTPIVSWHVLKTPVEISDAQLHELRMNIENNAPNPSFTAPCYRAIQPQLLETSVYSCP